MADRNLTAIERRGLRQRINMADGHARQTLSAAGVAAASDRISAILSSGSIDIPNSEARFFDAFATRVKADFPKGRRFILYSASISVDLAAKLLRARGLPVQLMIPTFDNLAALIGMNGVEVGAIAEEFICPVPDFERIRAMNIRALFLVLPNNPTGARVSYEDLLLLFEWAARNDVLLILDLSFRYLISDYCVDMLADADNIGASVVLIDDTGKVLSFFDSKMSVVTCTKDLVTEVSRIHEELLLNASALEMEMLALFLDPSGVFPDELSRARRLVLHNRHLLQAVLRRSGIEPIMERDEEMSVEWVRLAGDAKDTLRGCAMRGLELLPGGLFYWDKADDVRGQQFVRVALMRDEDVVAAGCDILRSVLMEGRAR